MVKNSFAPLLESEDGMNRGVSFINEHSKTPDKPEDLSQPSARVLSIGAVAVLAKLYGFMNGMLPTCLVNEPEISNQGGKGLVTNSVSNDLQCG